MSLYNWKKEKYSSNGNDQVAYPKGAKDPQDHGSLYGVGKVYSRWKGGLHWEATKSGKSEVGEQIYLKLSGTADTMEEGKVKVEEAAPRLSRALLALQGKI